MNTSCTTNSSLNVPLTFLLAFVYLAYTTLTSHSSMPNFRIVQHTTYCDTLSKAFSKSTNAKHNFFFLLKYFSGNCFTKNIAPVVPHHGINPNCISSMFTFSLTGLLQSFQPLSLHVLSASSPYSYLVTKHHPSPCIFTIELTPSQHEPHLHSQWSLPVP